MEGATPRLHPRSMGTLVVVVVVAVDAARALYVLLMSQQLQTKEGSSRIQTREGEDCFQRGVRLI